MLAATQDVFSLSELFTALTDLLHLRHPVINQLRNYLSHKGISEEAVAPSLLSYTDVALRRSANVGADPRVSGSHTLLPPAAAAGAAQTIGSEDFSFNVMLAFDDEKQHMRRNQYEDALFRCEDDRFEADVILETTRSAAAQLESLERELQTAPARPLKLRDDALSAVQQAAIRRVYNHNGADVEVLKVGETAV